MLTAVPVSFRTAMPLRPPILLLSCLLGLTQCIMQEGGYPQQPMPDATQTGANTAGCVVDGLPWVANFYNTTIGVPAPRPVAAWWDNVSVGRPHLSLRFLKDIADQAQVHHDTRIELELPGITRPGTFVLDQPPPHVGQRPRRLRRLHLPQAHPKPGAADRARFPGPRGRDPVRHPGPRRVGHVRVHGPPGHGRGSGACDRRPLRLQILAA